MVDVDEELPSPLTGSAVAVVDGTAVLWFSGGNFENGRHRMHFDEPMARDELALSLFRARDRLQPDFADAPSDEDLTDAQRGVWDAWADGRAAAPRRGDAAGAAAATSSGSTTASPTSPTPPSSGCGRPTSSTWADLEAIGAECAEADPRPEAKKRVPGKESLRR